MAFSDKMTIPPGSCAATLAVEGNESSGPGQGRGPFTTSMRQVARFAGSQGVSFRSTNGDEAR
jgi:hypothetical protein